MNLRVLVADDEPLSLDLLSVLVERAEGAALAGRASSGQAAIDAVVNGVGGGGIDLLLLDVQMPEVNGFEVIRRIQADILPLVVFVSAYARYAVDAFGVNAVDYLVKPVEEDRLYAALAKARAQRAAGVNTSGAKTTLMRAARSAAGAAAARVADDMRGDPPATSTGAAQEGDTIVLRERGRTTYLPRPDITWVEAAGDYVLFHTNDDTHTLRGTMGEAEALLGGLPFARIHRSTIVNTSLVREVIATGKGDAVVRLSDGRTLRASRRYRDVLGGS